MKRIIRVIFVILCLLPIKLFAQDKVKVYVFEAGGCPFCEQEITYLKSLEGYNKEFVVVQKELYIDHIKWQNGKDYSLGNKVVKAFNEIGYNSATVNSTPLIIISDVFAESGYNDSLESIINYAFENGDKDVVGCYEKGNDDCGINKDEVFDNDTTLSNLVISVGELSPKFDKEISDYEVKVNGTIEELNVNAMCSGTNCKVSGDGIVKLNNGNNEVVIKVTAENGDEQYYRINIFREENYYSHLYIGVTGALVIIIITFVLLIWSTIKNKNK